MVKVIHEKHKCINCGACLESGVFSMGEAGVELTDTEYKKNEAEETIIGTKETEKTPELEEAANICPVQCIKLEE